MTIENPGLHSMAGYSLNLHIVPLRLANLMTWLSLMTMVRITKKKQIQIPMVNCSPFALIHKGDTKLCGVEYTKAPLNNICLHDKKTICHCKGQLQIMHFVEY